MWSCRLNANGARRLVSIPGAQIFGADAQAAVNGAAGGPRIGAWRPLPSRELGMARV